MGLKPIFHRHPTSILINSIKTVHKKRKYWRSRLCTAVFERSILPEYRNLNIFRMAMTCLKSIFDLAGGQVHRIIDLHIDPVRFDCLNAMDEKQLSKTPHPLFLPGQNCREKLETPLFQDTEGGIKRF